MMCILKVILIVNNVTSCKSRRCLNHTWTAEVLQPMKYPSFIAAAQHFNYGGIIGRCRFPRWPELWAWDITISWIMSCVQKKFRRFKHTWKECFWGLPPTGEHDVTFRCSCSGKRLSKPSWYKQTVLTIAVYSGHLLSLNTCIREYLTIRYLWATINFPAVMTEDANNNRWKT